MENSLLWKEQLVQCNFPECYLEMDPGLTGRRVTFNQVNDDDHHHHGAGDYYNDENGDDIFFFKNVEQCQFHYLVHQIKERGLSHILRAIFGLAELA